MSFYDAMKDAVNLAQKADNIELYRQLLDLSAQALDMQAEIARLKEENERLAKELEKRADVVYHKSKAVDDLHNEYPYITLKSDPSQIRYCAVCWGRDNKLIPLHDELNCYVCLFEKRK